MISDLKNLLARHEDIEESAIKEAAYNLLARQFLLQHKGRHRKHYDLVVRFPGYFRNLMEALNYELVISEERGYVGAVPLDYTRRMSLAETLVLFTLRYLYDEAVTNFSANEDGTVELTVEDFEIRHHQFTKRDLPKTKGDFDALIAPFIRCAILEHGADEEHPEIERLRILPTITALLNGEAIKRIEVYLRAEDIDTSEHQEDESVEEDEA
ncbi:DUF4194 domain-containing protein [Thioalkalivibrio thiocyanodenitrificans]|uniref:DUF4194 domain-containing protein n=1 Tax=Thioalkalivibrio thiocyanodenitrificans TaxID=243063 RepID=UPI000376D1A9|nr:DUF4194 domain-containing protein [Thioalkalivibrio thiocyanodenitrificans]